VGSTVLICCVHGLRGRASGARDVQRCDRGFRGRASGVRGVQCGVHGHVQRCVHDDRGVQRAFRDDHRGVLRVFRDDHRGVLRCVHDELPVPSNGSGSC